MLPSIFPSNLGAAYEIWKVLAALTLLFLTSSASAPSFAELGGAAMTRDCTGKRRGVKDSLQAMSFLTVRPSHTETSESRFFSRTRSFTGCRHGQPVVGQVATICLYISGRDMTKVGRNPSALGEAA